MLLLLLRLCCWLAALAALAPIALAAPTGKLAPERKDKEEWRDALNSWQADENQEFMREYDEHQKERERIRERNMPKFDPANPKKCAASAALLPRCCRAAAARGLCTCCRRRRRCCCCCCCYCYCYCCCSTGSAAHSVPFRSQVHGCDEECAIGDGRGWDGRREPRRRADHFRPAQARGDEVRVRD
jgi:hypothetical protein